MKQREHDMLELKHLRIVDALRQQAIQDLIHALALTGYPMPTTHAAYAAKLDRLFREQGADAEHLSEHPVLHGPSDTEETAHESNIDVRRQGRQ